MAVKFKNTININDQYTFPTTVGTDGQYLSVTDAAAGQLDWTNIGDVDGLKSNFVYYDAKNSTGSTIPVGTAVMAVGTDGNSGHILIAPMQANGTVEPKYFIGVTDTAIDNGVIGKVVHFGVIDQVNTNAFSDGDVLWCDPNTPGGFTTTEPEAPAVKLASAIVLNSSTNGKLLVRVQGNEGLHELHDVNIENVQEGDTLSWDATNGHWKNIEATTGGGGVLSVKKTLISGDGSTTVFTLSASVEDENLTQVYIDGVYQSKENYSVLGNQITFSEAPDNGTDVEVIHFASISAIVNVDAFTGNGSTSQYTLSQNVSNENDTQVYFDGVYQSKSNYSVSGNVVTFSENVSSGVEIEVVHLKSADISTLNSNQFTGTGAQTDFTLVQSIDNKDKAFVFIQGVYQEKSTYTIDGQTLSFLTAPDAGYTIEVVTFSTLSVAADTLYLDSFSGNGTQTDYTISASPSTENAVDIYINGLYQDKSTFSVSGSTVTFSTPPPSTSTIEVKSVSGITGTPQNVNYGVVVASSNTNASKNTLYVLKADLTLTLPASPATGDSIKISNLSGVATCVLGANGNNIMATSGDLTLDDASKSFELIYTDATNGWVIIG